MRNFIKITGIILLGLIIFNVIYSYVKPEGVKYYINNKELETIKKDWQGNLKIGKEYTNGRGRNSQIMPLDIIKWKISKNPQKDEKEQDSFQVKVRKNTNFLEAKQDMIVWLGHATFFIRINGKTLLTDPVLNDVSFIKRLTGVACDIDDLKQIDFILLSHGHRDHFDKKSLKSIFRNNPDIEALVPMELNTFFDRYNIKNQQAGWYQKYKTTEDLEIYFMPAKHWNRRGPFDFNRNLWGSFVIKSNGISIYFSGDTAYGEHFKEINQTFGKIDYCLMSVGAYKPEYIMKDTHMSPTEALNAFEDLQGEFFIPMHFGTYDLSDEPVGEPVRIIEKEKDNINLKFLDIGEILLTEKK